MIFTLMLHESRRQKILNVMRIAGLSKEYIQALENMSYKELMEECRAFSARVKSTQSLLDKIPT